MKKSILMIAMTLMVSAVGAQRNAQDYFVKTKNAKEVAPKVAATAKEDVVQEEEKAHNLMNELFPRLSLCDWNDSMVFMVLPDKRDLVLRVFNDGYTNNSVSTMSLNHQLLRYQGHSHDNGTNRDRINFVTEDGNRHPYYFEVPSGTFEDYCFTKYGVPSLAYINDVETARKVMLGKTLVTKSTAYRIDATYGEGSEEIQVPLDTEVKVVRIGVGTRAFPVKIIVADRKGREFFQNVAISRTNSGLRDEEFNMMDNQHHTFETAFDMMGDFALPSWHYDSHLGKVVFARRALKLKNTRGDEFTFPGLTTFKIMQIKSQRGKSSVKMTLQNTKNGTDYIAEVHFKDTPGAADVVGERDDIFENLFGEGNPASMKGVDARHIAAIRQGKIQKGFTETEVKLVREDDYEVVAQNNRTYSWQFSALYGKPSIRVVFDKRTKRVIQAFQAR
jgi:hypothetical protein